ncbi:Sugar transport protein [Quillaja saponaria]|uniref:Sugar transport protein n=1 Tax=Quillaja saponaria TaxID=32244 RepID=A0AAD7M6Q7_QUISA|nr:Sugar transport protein [Quillaja saponaria]
MAGVFVNDIGDHPIDFEKKYPGKLRKNYPRKPTKKYYGELHPFYVYCTCTAAAFGGLNVGYDIGISGGVTSMNSFLNKFFPYVYEKATSDISTNQYRTTLILFMSSLYLAALVASFVAARITKKFGPRWSMVTGSLIFLVGEILNLWAQNVAMLIIARILLGIGVGFFIQFMPAVSEMAPYNYRGFLNQVFQLFIAVGILIANLVNFLAPKFCKGITENLAYSDEEVIKAEAEFEGAKVVKQSRIKQYRHQVIMFSVPMLFKTNANAFVGNASLFSAVINVFVTFLYLIN